MTSQWIKDPAAVLDYTIDWTAWLTEGETITASTWTVPAGLTEQSTSATPTAATVWLAGGTVGAGRYTVTNEITTSDGRTDERSIQITCLNR